MRPGRRCGLSVLGKKKNRGANMTSDFPAGNYRFIPAVFQYSGGVAANPGYEIERVRAGR